MTVEAGETQVLSKLTAALMWKPGGPDFFDLPAFRAFATLADWNNEADRAGVAPVFASSHGATYGVQLEHWWQTENGGRWPPSFAVRSRSFLPDKFLPASGRRWGRAHPPRVEFNRDYRSRKSSDLTRSYAAHRRAERDSSDAGPVLLR